MRTLVIAAVLAASPDAGVAWNSNTSLNSTQALEQCRAALPACKAPFAEYVAPPHPCANRGAACPPELLNAVTTGPVWACGCDECTSDADCSKGMQCGTQGPVDPCSNKHVARVCVKKKKADAGAAAQLLAPCSALPPAKEPSSVR